MKSTIKKLAEAYGPSGREDAIRAIVADEIRGNVQSIEISPLGSLHAFMNRGGKRKVMLAAHMDEIGVIVSHVDQHGCARFQPMGNLDLEALPGHGARFPGEIVGVFGLDLERSGEKPPRVGEYFIDFGTDGKQGCPVGVGDFGVLDRPFLDLGRRLVAKSLYARIGVAILIEVIRRIPETPHELQFAFTVQEEVGGRGGTTSTFMLDPDVAIAVDAAANWDLPAWRAKMALMLGKGPAMNVWHTRMLSDPRLLRHMAGVASETGIAYQMDVRQSGEAEATPIQLTKAGVPWGCISVPVRYGHTPSEMVDYGDVEQTVRLLLELIKRPMDFIDEDLAQEELSRV